MISSKPLGEYGQPDFLWGVGATRFAVSKSTAFKVQCEELFWFNCLFRGTKKKTPLEIIKNAISRVRFSQMQLLLLTKENLKTL